MQRKKYITVPYEHLDIEDMEDRLYQHVYIALVILVYIDNDDDNDHIMLLKN